jgi:hypothetical protein
MSTLRPARPAQADTATVAPAQVHAPDTVPARHGRLRDAAARRGVPLATILTAVAVVVLTYLAGKLAYRIRDVLLMIAVASFACLSYTRVIREIRQSAAGALQVITRELWRARSAAILASPAGRATADTGGSA